MFIYFWDRERQSMNEGGSERGRNRIWSRLQAPNYQHRAWRRAQTHRPWDHVLSRSRTLNQLSHPGTPNVCLFLREREREAERKWGERGRERGRHRIQSRLQAPSPQHRPQCGAQTHKPWDHDLIWSWMLNRLSHPGAPASFAFLAVIIHRSKCNAYLRKKFQRKRDLYYGSKDKHTREVYLKILE